jgi:putative transposase
LFEKIDAGEIQLDGDGGFIQQLIKTGLERGLQAELSEHLGYVKGDPAGHGSPNSRNGTTPKTLASEVGDLRLDGPRDRAGTFEPRLVSKGSRRVGGLDEMIISLYAGGMTVRDIQHHLARTIGTDLSPDTISTITDAVLDEVREWQARPLEEIYPIIYLDALVVKVRDGHQVKNRAAHIAIGVDLDGVKHVLGIWVQATEGAKFWAGVCAELRNRGVNDVLVVCCDGLTGRSRPGRTLSRRARDCSPRSTTRASAWPNCSRKPGSHRAASTSTSPRGRRQSPRRSSPVRTDASPSYGTPQSRIRASTG